MHEKLNAIIKVHEVRRGCRMPYIGPGHSIFPVEFSSCCKTRVAVATRQVLGLASQASWTSTTTMPLPVGQGNFLNT